MAKINRYSEVFLGIFLFSGIIITSIVVVYIAVSSTTQKITAGQVWIYDSCVDDPFKNPCPVENEVLDIKNGYIKYKSLETGIIESSSIRYFLIDSTIKK
ncbi:MAG: hypothetical protein WC055_01055 [Melioribacteraceae bacterium]